MKTDNFLDTQPPHSMTSGNVFLNFLKVFTAFPYATVDFCDFQHDKKRKQQIVSSFFAYTFVQWMYLKRHNYSTNWFCHQEFVTVWRKFCCAKAWVISQTQTHILSITFHRVEYIGNVQQRRTKWMSGKGERKERASGKERKKTQYSSVHTGEYENENNVYRTSLADKRTESEPCWRAYRNSVCLCRFAGKHAKFFTSFARSSFILSTVLG